MQYIFGSMLLMVAWAALTFWCGLSSQNHAESHPDQINQETSIPQAISFLTHTMKQGFARELSFTREFRDEIVALGTLFLALTTFALFIATHDLVKGADKNSERQLRAYVFIKDGAVQLVPHGTGGTEYVVHIVLKNFGQTPGYHYSTWLNGEVLPVEAVPFPKDAKPLSDRVNSSIIGPNAETRLITEPTLISADEIESIRKKKKAIFVWGGVDYVDAFDQPRYFIFRMRMTGSEQNAGGWPLTPHPLGYEAN